MRIVGGLCRGLQHGVEEFAHESLLATGKLANLVDLLFELRCRSRSFVRRLAVAVDQITNSRIEDSGGFPHKFHSRILGSPLVVINQRTSSVKPFRRLRLFRGSCGIGKARSARRMPQTTLFNCASLAGVLAMKSARRSRRLPNITAMTRLETRPNLQPGSCPSTKHRRRQSLAIRLETGRHGNGVQVGETYALDPPLLGVSALVGPTTACAARHVASPSRLPHSRRKVHHPILSL